MSQRGIFRWFEERREWGAVFVRVLIGFHLMWGTQDNVFSHARMLEFRDFLTQTGFPFPLFSAHLRPGRSSSAASSSWWASPCAPRPW